MADIFVSYSSQNRLEAKALAEKFEAVGFSVFFDRKSLMGGDLWSEVLDRELNAASVVVGLWSKSSLTNEWPLKEFNRSHSQKKLVPIQIEPLEAVDIPLAFEGLQWIGFWENSEHEWNALHRAVLRRVRHSIASQYTPETNREDQKVHSELRPLVSESTTSESTNVEVVLGDMKKGLIGVPDYQRDSQQWGDDTKSLFIESVINNLAIPAFFFEPRNEGGREVNDVVDGQQRLSTLVAFYENDFQLVPEDKAPYLSEQCSKYAGRHFDDLPTEFKETFLRHRLTIIKLRGLGEHRLEVFRRINQGGTPLSGQDIRLAYYGSQSPSNTFIRIVGIYDRDRDAARRFLRSAKDNFNLNYPWSDETQYALWNDLWEDKPVAIGQTPSEMFLWALLAARHEEIDKLTQSKENRGHLNINSAKMIDEVLDLYCAQSQFQDRVQGQAISYALPQNELRESFFPFFASMFSKLVRNENKKMNVTKHRHLAMLIGVSWRLGKKAEQLSPAIARQLFQFVDSPRSAAQQLDLAWPESKGRWHGPKGYAAQIRLTKDIVAKIWK